MVKEWLGCWAWGMLLVLAVLISGCNRSPDQVKVVAVDAGPGAAASQSRGIVIKKDADLTAAPAEGDEVTVEQMVMQVRQERFIIAKPGETLRLFSEWSGIPPEELKLVNNDQLPVFGNKYVLSLTAAEFAGFEHKRQDYWNERKREMYDQHDIKPVEYIVKKNDTLDGISRKHDIPLWFLAMHNEALDPYRMAPGVRIIVPKLVARTAPAAAAEAAVAGEGQVTEEDLKEVYPVIVKKGETIGEYAKWGQITIDDIKRANRNMKSLDRVRVGDTINLPLTAKQFRRFQELRKAKEEKK